MEIKGAQNSQKTLKRTKLEKTLISISKLTTKLRHSKTQSDAQYDHAEQWNKIQNPEINNLTFMVN